MWIRSFSDKDIYAPYTIEKDSDYQDDLRKRYSHFIELMWRAGADDESLSIARYYANTIQKALLDYYCGRIIQCHNKIKKLVKDASHNSLALSELNTSRAFHGDKGTEIQFYRARTDGDAKTFSAKEMLHVPFSMRSKSGNYRFSIPGVVSLYLANTSYGCWIESGRPAERDFNVAPVVLDGKQRIFNLAVMTRDVTESKDGDLDTVHCWIKLLALMIATSYRVKEIGRSFKSEYIISQSIMLACKQLGYDGIAYYSKRVEDEIFAEAAVNLALFANYRKDSDHGEICEHLKIDESMNYQLFRQLLPSLTYQGYRLRIDTSRFINNIGYYEHQYTYRRQFNCAHELGHILLHEKYSDLNELNREEFRAREDEANAFAASFLLPESSFGKDVSAFPNRLSHYIELKKKWNVSIMAMIMRAYSLKFLTQSQYSYLMKQMSINGYRLQEPLDNLVEYKHPRALRQAINILLTKANMSGEDIINLFSSNGFSVSSNIIEELIDLPQGTLSGTEPKNIIELPTLR